MTYQLSLLMRWLSFIFEHYYLQISGTAMGVTTHYGPDYANLYLYFLEKQEVFNNNPFLHQIVLFKRYVDDCFFIFRGSSTESEFFCLVNKLFKNINQIYSPSQYKLC